MKYWLSPDPLGEVGGMNLYAYVFGDPINGWDPYGLEFWAWNGTAGAWTENATTFSAGFSDNFTFGLTGVIRGTYAGNNDVDKCSNSYKGGDYTATGIQLAAGGTGLAKGIARGGFKMSAKAAYREGTSMAWSNVRKRLGYHGIVESGEQVHHWMIPQNGWGKAIPGTIKNLPFNLMPIGKEAHIAAHSGNLLKAAIYGTPAWAKQAAVGLGAGATHAVSGGSDCP